VLNFFIQEKQYRQKCGRFMTNSTAHQLAHACEKHVVAGKTHTKEKPQQKRKLERHDAIFTYA
jgi:hypothetical protein